MQQRALSSASTIWVKFLLPALWVPGFGIGVVVTWFDGSRLPAPLPDMRFVMLAAWIGGSAILLLICARLKRVGVDERELLISNYLREIRVPFSAIVDVRQNRWLNMRPITIHFREATAFGDRATFIPKSRIHLRFWREDPAVEELKQLAGLTPAA
jgi:hypothetical protein